MTPRSRPLRPLRVALIVAAALMAACDQSGNPPSADSPPTQQVVIYTALDRVHSEPILRAFEERTGITVRAQYDVEAAKTTGLINALMAERDRPRCDVLWNNEMIQTQALADMGLFEPYASPQAQRFPDKWRDPRNRWTGFAARLRVILYNTTLVTDDPPSSLTAFADPRWRGQAAIAEPYFGTTFTHMLMLHDQWGPAKLTNWWQAALANDLAIAPGNGPVRDLVAAGERAFGLTDTDDALAAIRAGKPVAITLPNASQGAILMPNTLALIRGAPHPQNARKLIDYLLSPQVERALARGASGQIPLANDLGDVRTPWDDLLTKTPPRQINIAALADHRETVIDLLDNALAGRR